MKVKISAIDSLDEALNVVLAGADIVEIIICTQPDIDTRSKSKEIAHSILQKLIGKVETSILTDKTDLDELLNFLIDLPIGYLFPIFNLQEEVMKKIKEKLPLLKIVPTIHVVDKSSLIEIEAFNRNPYVDLIHLDSKTKNKLGATGLVHDWPLSAKIVKQATKPVILAGGLNPENVAEAIDIVQPFGVDVYSGVLNGNGELDLERVKKFIKNAKA